MSSMDLHIFFFPFLAPGHMIPMVDMAKLFADRGVKVSIVTTTGNASRIQPTLDRSPHLIQLLTIPFQPSVAENLTSLPSPDLKPDFLAALDTLKSPFQRLLIAHRPDCIVTDIMYPWSADLAVELTIPRICFHGSSSFTVTVMSSIRRFGSHESMVDEEEPLVVPRIPHRIEVLRSQLPGGVAAMADRHIRMAEAQKKTFGTLMNSFYEMEEGYTNMFDGKAWLVGPVSLCDGRETIGTVVRGGGGGECEFDDCLNWLDSKKPGSVLYVCFGSVSKFTCSQLCEIARGLIFSGYPFIWVVRNMDDSSEWMPEGFNERGFVIKGWAPQMTILNHRAIGGFLTHCGWNSCLEGASAGLPMITWPLFAEQFLNERLLVDVLRIGVAVGSKVCTTSLEKRTVVSGDEVKKAVEEVMGSGEDAEERRKRAKKIAEMARKAVEEGGSSYNELSSLIQELIELKRSKK